VNDPPDRLMPERTFEDEFRRLFDGQFGSVFRYLDRLSGDPALAADLAQETFVRLFRRGSMPDMPRAWLAAVAANLLRDDRRTAARRQSLIGAAVEQLRLESSSAAPDAEVLAGERRAMVRRTLDGLPERDRRILLLRYEGYSYREIALALDLPETSVGTFLARARRAFQAAFEEIHGGSG
jgi:RNA polymerase sigma factor (sigma-70 family)